MKRIFALMIKELRQLKADPLMSRLLVVPVLLQLFIIGYAITTDVRNIPIGICDLDRSELSSAMIRTIDTHRDLFIHSLNTTSIDSLNEAMRRGTIKAGVVIQRGFGEAIPTGKGSALIMVDGQDANSAQVSAGYLSAIITQWNQSRERAEGKIPAVTLSVRERVLYNPNLLSTWYMIPGLVAILVTMVTGLLTGFSIVKEKEGGTIDQLLVSPITPFEIVVGKVLPFTLIGVVQMVVLLLISALWFHIPFRGDIGTVLIFTVLYMLSTQGLSIYASTIAQSSQQVLFLLWFFLIFFMLLSGFLVPVENMPAWVQQITEANPMRWFIAAARGFFLRGDHFHDLLPEALRLTIIGAVIFPAAIINFSRKAG